MVKNSHDTGGMGSLLARVRKEPCGLQSMGSQSPTSLSAEAHKTFKNQAVLTGTQCPTQPDAPVRRLSLAKVSVSEHIKAHMVNAG